METFLSLNDKLCSILWGPIMLPILMLLGIYLTFKTRFFQITHFCDTMKNTIGSLKKPQKTSGKGISPFQAVSTALAGTLGTGNIIGVAAALCLGGPGAIFWMWVSAFFGMIIKYAEVVLSVSYRTFDKKGNPHGGPMYVMKNALGKKFLANIFCICCVLASFGIGSSVQSNAATSSLNSAFEIPPIFCAVAFGGASLLVLAGGVKRIGEVAEKIVPAMAALYILLAIIVLIAHAKNIPVAFEAIFKDAFSFKSSASGFAGFTISNALRYGVSRGVFSNEAGLGSAPIAHGASDTDSPVKQGMWGIFEVFFDTIVMCTVTALILITTGAFTQCDDASNMAIFAFNSCLGSMSGGIIAICMSFFAFASIIGWAYYGEQSIRFLFGGRFVFIYRIIYSLSASVGCLCSLNAIWQISDTLNGLMMIPNIICIILLRKKVIKKTLDYSNSKK